MPDTRHEEALRLAEELLSDIEYTKIAPSDIARKASRLARLTDDVEAMVWLRFEIAGYTKPANGFFTDDEVTAAERSGRFMMRGTREHTLISRSSMPPATSSGHTCFSVTFSGSEPRE